MKVRAVKYFSLFGCELKSIFQYSVDAFFRLIKSPLRIFLVLFFWIMVFKLTAKTNIASLDESSFLSYILISGIIASSFSPWSVYECVEENIKRGHLSVLLSRPISHLPYVFIKAVKNPLFDVLLCIPVGFFVFLLQPVPLTTPSFLFFTLFLVSAILSILLAFLLYYSISIFMFWTGDMWSIWGIVDSLEVVLSGQLIPLTISPVLNFFASFLPFKYMVFVPGFIFINAYSIKEAFFNIGMQFAWIIILFIISSIIFNMGLRKCDNQGG